MHVGRTYQNNWIGTLEMSETIASGLWNNLSATKQFKYNLWNKEYYWYEGGGDGAANSLESVDMFFAITHGGAWAWEYAELAMWEDEGEVGPPFGALATTDLMVLGNESRGLSILALHACMTLAFDDYFWQRWDSVFSGGLRMALGSHGDVNTGSGEAGFGSDFASYLNAGKSLKDSWAYAFDHTAYNNQDAAIATVGRSSADCDSRRDTMTWKNFGTFSRVGAEATNWCGWYWDDI
jgi:hypothetical protein